eukprot:TRINITY_DN1489_c0_g1_i4.p1 TRINITY_DN1489_c0_g1~~TRINITY_DN1489_c0_g1_i4.p1  ORF type:complete len:174 (+),score=24.97 TRINITY_DN1489_c0_g1_i4:39-524(+)
MRKQCHFNETCGSDVEGPCCHKKWNQSSVSESLEQTKSFYQRPLPDHLISFSSSEGKFLFRQALEAGHMEAFFRLSEQFSTQQEPAFCALATLSMCLNAMKIDPNRVWKGPWRWYSDEMLDCCISLEIIKEKGLTIKEFICLARCEGIKVDSKPADTGFSF